MRRYANSMLIGLAMTAMAAPAVASPFVVDGNLADWGIAVADGVANQRNPGRPGPNYGSNKIGIVEGTDGLGLGYTFDGVGVGTDYSQLSVGGGLWSWAVEDSNDTLNGYHLGPHSGGQNYDVEFVALAAHKNNIFAAILSGIRPDNGASEYGPGDVFITVKDGATGKTDTYVMEVGGGAGGGAGGALQGGSDGTHYTLNGSGYTTASTQTPGVKTGSIWRTSDVNIQLDPIAPNEPAQIKSIKAGATAAAQANDYLFTRNSATTSHSIIEFSLNMTDFFTDMFDPDNTFSMYFGPSCNNDFLTASGTPPVPEPASLLLLAGGLGVLGLRRRRRS